MRRQLRLWAWMQTELPAVQSRTLQVQVSEVNGPSGCCRSEQLARLLEQRFEGVVGGARLAGRDAFEAGPRIVAPALELPFHDRRMIAAIRYRAGARLRRKSIREPSLHFIPECVWPQDATEIERIR